MNQYLPDLQPSKSCFVWLRLVTKRRHLVGGRVAVPRRVAHSIFADRNVGLPGGALNFAPVENSATGKVVVPRGDCRFEKMSNITFEFKNGKMENFQASQGKKCLTT
jgi:leucyl aminopeptidase (aminopeptidase T)